MEYFSTTKKKEIISSATTWKHLEIIILSDVSQTEKDKNIAFMQNLKKIYIYIYICINEIIYKTDSQTLKMNLWLPVGKSGGEE